MKRYESLDEAMEEARRRLAQSGLVAGVSRGGDALGDVKEDRVVALAQILFAEEVN